MEIFVIISDSGEYDTRYTRVLPKAYYNFSDAEEKVKELKYKYDFIDKFDTSEIDLALNESIPDSYYDDDNAECCWDNFDIFLLEMEKLFPEIYKSEKKEDLKILGDYFCGYLEREYFIIKKLEVV